MKQPPHQVAQWPASWFFRTLAELIEQSREIEDAAHT